jgi:hypothetical protein
MQKRWPWHCLAICELVGLLLYIRALIGVQDHRMGTLAACVFAFEFLLVGVQFVLHSQWEAEWKQNRVLPSTASAMPSERAQFYYVLGLIQLYCVLIYLDIATFGFLFNGETFVATTFGLAVAHGLLKDSRRLAPIADEVQHDARKMADLGLERQATPEEMTKTAIVVMGLGVALTILLCASITYGSYDISSNLMLWWLGIPTLIVLALALIRRPKRSQVTDEYISKH